MTEPSNPTYPSALSTRVEEDFITPLTAVRGALEILRDVVDLAPAEQRRFVETALRGCARLESGVEELAASVYQAARRDGTLAPTDEAPPEGRNHEARIRFDPAHDVVEIDFSGLVFPDSTTVDAFYDVVERRLAATGRRWYILANHENVAVWPEAWVASAHRAKRVSVTYALATVRYAAAAAGDDMLSSREAALVHIEGLKRVADGA